MNVVRFGIAHIVALKNAPSQSEPAKGIIERLLQESQESWPTQTGAATVFRIQKPGVTEKDAQIMQALVDLEKHDPDTFLAYGSICNASSYQPMVDEFVRKF